jgi:hypothetical protein
VWLLGSVYALLIVGPDVFPLLTDPGWVINRVFSLHGLLLSLKDRLLVIVLVIAPLTQVVRITADLP